MAPPDIGRSDNPMSTGGKGADYAHLITTGTSGFSDLPTALEQNLSASAWLHFQQLFYRKSNFMLFLLTASTFTGLLYPWVPGVA